MKRTDIDELRDKIIDTLKPWGVWKVALFGSVARGEESSESDIDILVQFKEPIGLFALARLKRSLSEKLGRNVDLVTEGALSPYIRPFVERGEIAFLSMR